MKFRKKFNFIFFALFFFNLALFLFKTFQVLVELPRRNAEKANLFIKQHIPVGSKVIGDPLFYYAVTENGSFYHYYNLYNTLENREEALRTKFDYDYMIVSGVSLARNAGISAYFYSKSEFDTVATLQFEENTLAGYINRLGLVSSMEASGYSCTLLIRVK